MVSLPPQLLRDAESLDGNYVMLLFASQPVLDCSHHASSRYGYKLLTSRNASSLHLQMVLICRLVAFNTV